VERRQKFCCLQTAILLHLYRKQTLRRETWLFWTVSVVCLVRERERGREGGRERERAREGALMWVTGALFWFTRRRCYELRV
jgi:hypothetical protein